MPSRTISLNGSIIEIRPAIVLGISDHIAIAAALYEAPWDPPNWIDERLEAALRGQHYDALSGLSLEDAAILVATLYGGVVLVVNYDPPTPAARIMPVRGLALENEECKHSRSEDYTLLSMWASIFWDKPSRGCSRSPPSLEWRYPGPLRIAPSGYRSRPVKQNRGG